MKGKKKKKGENKNQSSIIILELTPKLYEVEKRIYLKKIPPKVSPIIKSILRKVAKLSEDDIIRCIEKGNISLKDWVSKLNPAHPYKFGLNFAKKIIKKQEYKEKIDSILSYNTIANIIKYENPKVWRIIIGYGDKGEKVLRMIVNELRELIGLKRLSG